MTELLLSAVINLAALVNPADGVMEMRDWCGLTRLTGYVRTEFSSRTYDGTPIWTDEPIVAASWDVKMGSIAEIEGLGRYRVADRGHLGNGTPTPWVDIATWSRAEAYALTGYRNVCFRKPLQ
jgi:hypothetical protein